MKVGILGCGMVGKALKEGFEDLGHEVVIGTRNPDEKDVDAVSYKEAAQQGELLVLAVKGTEWDSAVKDAGKENFSDKVLIDVTNPLVQKDDTMVPAYGYPESTGKKLQKMLPEANVVKALNSVTSAYMCNAQLEEGTADMFIAGNESDAKNTVTNILKKWKWNVNDIGDIDQSYLLENLAMLWIRYGIVNEHWTHAFKLLNKK